MSKKQSGGLTLASIPLIAQSAPKQEILPALEQKRAHTARHQPRLPAMDFSDTDPATVATERAIRQTLAHIDDLEPRVVPTIEIPKAVPRPRESYAEELDALRAVMQLSNSLPPR